MATILLVDDDEMVRYVTQELLELSGYQVRKAPSGTEALACLETGEEIDLVLLDLSLPDIDGWELLPRMLELRPALRVVLATGSLQENAEETEIPVTVRAVLQKPFNLRTLTEAVQRSLAD